MKTHTRPQVEKGGFALLVVLFFIAAISTFLSMLAFSSSQRAYTVRRLTDGIKAQAMAEAGCEHGYAILSTDWESRYDSSAFDSIEESDDSQLSSLSSTLSTTDPAKFQVNVTPVGDNSALVTSTGTSGGATAISIVSVQDIGGSSEDDSVLSGEAFQYAILCGGTFTFRGCGTIYSPSGTAKFHSNGALDNRGSTHANINLSSSVAITSGKVTFGGDITAPSFGLHNQAVVLGTKTQAAVPVVAIPDIDLTPYYNWALKHGEVHNGFSTSSSYTPNGGIIWVNGDATVSSHAVISGSIIATGNIHISGQADINPTICAFSVASRDGNINVTSSGTLNGLVYAKTGGLDHTANGEIRGQIIVNGNIKKGGNSDIMTAFATYVPSPPGGSVTTDYIAITAWQK
jgi:hypothetical protein